jgi:quercetin dioxygenase-like cupin family protein
MTTRTPTVAGFTLSPSEGRTPQPLNILGTEVLVKLANADTHGAVAIFHETVAPHGGAPLHRNTCEDLWFYVLKGEITIEADGERSVLSAGSSAFTPRGAAYALQNFDDSPAQILAVATPGRLNLFLEELDSLNAGLPAPDMEGTERLATKYGMEILGPPLA